MKLFNADDARLLAANKDIYHILKNIRTWAEVGLRYKTFKSEELPHWEQDKLRDLGFVIERGDNDIIIVRW